MGLAAHGRRTRNQAYERRVCDPENQIMHTLTCAACGRSLAEAFAWKGGGERYYCNDFCAEAEEAESPALVPSMSEDALRDAANESRFLAKANGLPASPQ